MENLAPRDFESKKLKIIFFIRYFGDAFFYSFFQVFLAYKGLSESQIGIVAAITPFTSIIANPCWQFFSKDANTNRRILKVISIIEALLIISFTTVSSFEIICILTALVAIVGSPHYSLLDGFTATYCDINKKTYSKIRIYGSIAYVFSTTIGGILITQIGYNWVFTLSGIFMISASILFNFVRPLELTSEEKKPLKRDYRSLLTNKRFYFYLFFYIFTITVSGLGDTFFGVFLTKIKGLSESEYGMYYSYIVICECIIMFILGKWGKKIKDEYLFVFMGLSFSLRLLIAGLNLPTSVIVLCAGARGFAYGTFLYLNFNYIIKIVKLENVTAGILVIAIVNNTFLGIMNIFCGRLIESFGYNNVFLVQGIIIIIATFCFLIKSLIEIKSNPQM